MKNTVQILQRAKEYLQQGWTKGALARDKNGMPVREDSKSACAFCAAGAVFRARDELAPRQPTTSLRRALNDVLETGSFVAFNDAQETVEPVLALFDKAIAKLEAAQ